MDDITARYAPMIAQIARMYADDPAVHAQLLSLKVTREEWDDDRRGGHFWFDVAAPPSANEDFQVDARGDDVDGAMIDIIIHPVGGLLNWGEWYRTPLPPDDLTQPIGRWPPPSVRPNPPWKPTDREA